MLKYLPGTDKEHQESISSMFFAHNFQTKFWHIFQTFETFWQKDIGKKCARKTLMKLTPGVDFINFLRTAFTREEPKCMKKDSQVVSIFTLSGSTSVKAERKCVGEIDTWSQFHPHSTSSFCASRSQKRKKRLTNLQNFYAFGSYECKSCT